MESIKTYHIGQRFRVLQLSSSDTYMLCQVGPRKVCLINLRSGNRRREAVLVKDIEAITKEEFEKIAGIAPEFELVE